MSGDMPRLGVSRIAELVEPLPEEGRWPRSMQELIERWDDLRPFLEDLAEIGSPATRALADLTILAPQDTPSKIIGIGLNYRGHAAEGGAAVPAEPLVFAKFPSSIIGPDEAISWDPRVTSEVDAEAELAVVIGRRARSVSAAAAMDYVFGYTCLNDVSARDIQFSDGQWVRAKSLDSFCPLGPSITTRDEISDPQSLLISCSISGEVLQSASTADMYFGVADLVARLSRCFTLEPGDLIATGTPPGVGWFRKPKRLLRDGDEVTVSISEVGDLRNPVRIIRPPV